MILSGLAIRDEIEKGNIEITPYDESRLNPNSYNLRLHNELLVYTADVLDIKKPNPYETLVIPPKGSSFLPDAYIWGGRSSIPAPKTSCRCSKGVRRSAGSACVFM